MFLLYYIDNYVNYSTAGVIYVNVFYVVILIPITFYVYFNIKNISFSKYLKDLMKGLSLGENYKEASLFVFQTNDNKEVTRFSINQKRSDTKVSSIDMQIYEELDTTEIRDSTFAFDQKHMNDYKANFEKVMDK